MPELEIVVANLELMPLWMNEGKNAGVGERQLLLAEELHRAGLLSEAGLRAVKGVSSKKASRLTDLHFSLAVLVPVRH